MEGNAWVDKPGANWQQPAGAGSNLNGLGDHAVTLLSWADADAYCTWVYGALPSEAQWEYSARGPNSLTYPWGNSFDGQKNNFCDQNCPMDWRDQSVNDGFAQIAPVGSYVAGASWVGALDMVGNVWEWVNDWYGANYYAQSPSGNPPGAANGTEKILRSGAWVNRATAMRSAARNIVASQTRTSSFGFRCVLPSSAPDLGGQAKVYLPMNVG